MDNQERIQGGIDVLRREAKGARGKDRSWKTHNHLMRAAKAHIEAFGADFGVYKGQLSVEFAELLKL